MWRWCWLGFFILLPLAHTTRKWLKHRSENRSENSDAGMLQQTGLLHPPREKVRERESDCESGVCAEFCFGKFSWLCLLFSPTIFTLIWSFIAPVSFEANPDTKRLYDDLLSNYNRLIRPVVNNTETLTVWLGLKLSQLIEVNLKNQVMTTNLWVKQVSCSSCKSYFIFSYELSILLFSL